MKNILPLLLMSLGLVGCASSKITNLTPTAFERNSSGLYPIEMAWQTREHAIRPESLQPQVIVGTQVFPMERTQLMANRWEAVVPVPANESLVRYKFKVDYLYNAIPKPKKNSKLSPEYTLEIVERK